MSKKSGLAFLVGATAGALAILFMPEKKRKQAQKQLSKGIASIKENLEKVTSDKRVVEIFGKFNEESQKILTQTKSELAKMVDQVKDLDEGKYANIVDKVILKIKQGSDLTVDQLTKLKQEILSYYEIDQPIKK